MLNAGQVLNDRYQIVKMIGKGGMSTVYQAKDLTNGNLLAVKDVERTGTDANQAVEQSLVTEGKMLMQLSNNHLPRIYDIIEQPASFLLVMDFIQGESLDKVIAREGAQPMDRVLDWGMQICEVFNYLHNQYTPIIYRDMKPANVMLQPNGQLMMIDFGTARTQKVGVMMSADTLCLGTSGFAAPEQFGGMGQSDARTDIFCLGGTLYNMITGHSPSDRPMGIRPLEEWNPALKDTPISYIIYKCTRNDPDARYQTAMELYEDLRKARAGTFGDPNTWGNSGRLTGRTGKDFQEQNLKVPGGLSGGLSGLLPFGKGNNPEKGSTAFFGKGNNPEKGNTAFFGKTGRMDKGSGGQAAPAAPADNSHGFTQVNYQACVPENMPDSAQPADHPWKKITLIGLVTAVVMVLLGIVMILAAQVTAGLVCVIVALGAAVLAVIGLVFTRRAEAEIPL